MQGAPPLHVKCQMSSQVAVAHAFNPSNWEASLVCRVTSKTTLHRETLSKKEKCYGVWSGVYQ